MDREGNFIDANMLRPSDPRTLKILQELEPDVNYMEEQALIDAHILDSFLILELVAELEDTYHIRISPADIVAENFNSAKALWQMIERLKEER